MAVNVRIPTPLRRFTDGRDLVSVEARDIRGVLDGLEAAHPGLKARLCDDEGRLRRFVNLFYRDEDIRFLGELDTVVEDGSEVSIVPAIAGGR
jgi:molybdopterin synthase sulfur carrier subunit